MPCTGPPRSSDLFDHVFSLTHTTQVRMRAHRTTYTQARAHTQTHTLACIRIHTPHTYSITSLLHSQPTYARTHECTHRTLAYTLACTYTYIHMHTNAHTGRYTRTRTHMIRTDNDTIIYHSNVDFFIINSA